MSGTYLLSATTAANRLQWVVNGGWATSTPSYSNLGLFLDSGDAFGMKADFQSLGSGTYRQSKIIFPLYDKYVKNDLQKIVQLYSDFQYPSTTNVTDQYKKDILTEFFKISPTRSNDNAIGEAIFIKFGTFQDGQTMDDDFLEVNVIKTLLADIQSGRTNISTEAQSIKKILGEYGFNQWIREQDPTFGAQDNIGGISDFNAVTSAQADQLNTIKAAVRKVQGLPPAEDLSREDEVNINQCALISNLLHKGYAYKDYPTDWIRGNNADNKAFNGRIYPVTLDNFNPDSLVNMCTIPKTMKTFFNETTNVNSVVWGLDWIYSDKNGIKQEPIFKTNKSKTNSPFVDKTNQLVSKGFLPLVAGADIVDDIDNQKKGYTISGVKISYEGTNPSTARNDVKVDLTIKLDSLLALKSTCCYVALNTDDSNASTINERVEIKISDLVGATQSNRYETQVIATTPFQREFVPDFSRIRLKVSTNSQDLHGSDLLINLATIEHELTTPAEDGKTTLTISYRGYFEQAMNMPYNDALADNSLINNRLRRNEKIKEARQKKCSDKLIRELASINKEEERIEVENFHAKGGLIKRLYDSNFIYSYSLDLNAIVTGLNGNILDPRLNYVSKISRVTPAQRQQVSLYGKQTDPNLMRFYNQEHNRIIENRSVLGFDIIGTIPVVKQSGTGVVNKIGTVLDAEAVGGYENERFIFLGDLMDLLLDCLYDSNSADHRQHAKGMNLRFIMGTIRVPDPQNLDKYMTINPLQIPLDMGFFASWYHDTIIKKGITHYPVGVFIKDLLERLINDVIFDTCFSVLLPDERPPQLRSTFFTDCDAKDRWFKTYNTYNTTHGISGNQAPGAFGVDGEWFDPLDPYDKVPYRSVAREPNILMKKDVDIDISKNKNYCVIYQQSPSYFRQLKNQKKGNLLKNDPYCPTLLYGYNMANHQYIQSPTITKSNSSYLKEARFFSSQLGTLSLMSNIYDVSFQIAEKKINTMFYPGNIINFIITDFEGGSTERWPSLNTIKASLNESDPHKTKTLANTLGIGGYHIIKSVSYTLLNQATKNIVVSIATKFAGTDAIGDQNVGSTSTPYADEPADCIKQYNDAVDRLEQTEQKLKIDAENFDRILEAGVSSAANSVTTSGQTERANLVTGGSATVVPSTDPRVQAQKANEAAEKAAKIAAAGTPEAAIQNSYSYTMVAQYKKGTLLQGSTFDAVLFKDKLLQVKNNPNPDKSKSEVKIIWSVGTVSNGKFVEEKTYEVTHTN